jgi:DHA1 family bicyclomycin/chloramphenicol resistance-like MFS transporter
VFATLVLCMAFGEVATGLVVPALPALGETFGRPPETVQLTIVSFAAMFAVGQLFFGPFSDRRGRRTALLIGAVLTLAGSAISAAADSIWIIVAGRAIQGLGAASGYVVARAIVRDIYGAAGAPKAMALLFALMAASFLAAPLVGGALMDLASWRAGFIFAAALALAWLASTLVIMPETRTAAPAAAPQTAGAVYLGLFRHKGFLAFMLSHSVAYAGLYCFIAGAPYFFIDSLGMTPASYGVIAAIAMSGFLVGSTAARYAIPRWGIGRVIPASLTIMLVAAAGLVGLGLAGWLPVPAFVAIQFAYWFGAGFLAPNTAAGVMMSHPKAAGAAAAVLGFVQMCAAAAVSLWQGLIYDGSVFPLIGTQLALAVLTWLIWHQLKRHTA